MITTTEAIKIAQDLRSNYFPELRSKRIKFLFVSGKNYDYYMAINWMIFEYRIYIEKEALKFSPNAFRGCMAHELSHLVIDMKKSFFRRFAEVFRGWEESQEERQCDAMVIERNLGEELLEFQRQHGKRYRAYTSSEGLTKREIKKILRNRK